MKEILNKIFVTSFFGWNNIKFIIKELIKIGSSKQSFFSKKRIEAGIAFFVLQWGMIESMNYMLEKENTPMSEFAMWAAIEAFICGYALNKIEEAKNKSDERK
jgi:hypothetical protein